MDKNLVKKLERILDALVHARKLSNDEMEIVFDKELIAIRSLPHELIVDALRFVVHGSKKRKDVVVYLIGELIDAPGALEYFDELFSSSDIDGRQYLVQIIGAKKLKIFTGAINKILTSKENELLLRSAIHAAGEIKDPSSLPLLLNITHLNNPMLRSVLVWSLKNYASEVCVEYFKSVFDDGNSNKQDKIVAAWGLVSIGKKEYLKYIVDMLHDEDVKTPNSFTPGASFRAAQAIAYIQGWEFQWNKKSVEEIKKRYMDR